MPYILNTLKWDQEVFKFADLDLLGNIYRDARISKVELIHERVLGKRVRFLYKGCYLYSIIHTSS